MSMYSVKVDQGNGFIWHYGVLAETVDKAIDYYYNNWCGGNPDAVLEVKHITDKETYVEIIKTIGGQIEKIFLDMETLSELGKGLSEHMGPSSADRSCDARVQWEIRRLTEVMQSKLAEVIELCDLHHSFGEDGADGE